jgi:DNA-binding transcriptional regulator YhcF (GntR family)
MLNSNTPNENKTGKKSVEMWGEAGKSYTILANALIKHSGKLNITDSEFRLIVCLSMFHNMQNGRINPSQETLAEMMGKNVRNVRRAISSLEDKGYLKTEGKGGISKKGKGKSLLYDLSPLIEILNNLENNADKIDRVTDDNPDKIDRVSAFNRTNLSANKEKDFEKENNVDIYHKEYHHYKEEPSTYREKINPGVFHNIKIKTKEQIRNEHKNHNEFFKMVLNLDVGDRFKSWLVLKFDQNLKPEHLKLLEGIYQSMNTEKDLEIDKVIINELEQYAKSAPKNTESPLLYALEALKNEAKQVAAI